MKIGHYEILVVETGRFKLDGGAMFGVVPKILWEKNNPADERNRIELALRAMLLKSDERLILIETGAGDKLNIKHQNIYDIDNSQYSMAKSFAKYNLSFSDVTDVILTHLHFDHAGGTTYKIKDNLKLTFPNAKHYVQAEHWEWANTYSEIENASFVQDNFTQIETEGKLQKINGKQQLFPNIEVIPVYGHTKAMQLVKFSDGNNTLLYCADLIPTASHIPLLWVMGYDNCALQTVEEKKRILPLAVKEEWILYFVHDPFRPAGTVQLTKQGYRLNQEIYF